MKVALWFVGKTGFAYLQEGIGLYEKRLRHYLPFEVETIPDLKNTKSLSTLQIKQKEGERILQKLHSQDRLLLLDERGKHMDSVAFAGYWETQLQQPARRCVLLVGGAYGFSEQVYKRAQGKIALSKMTFSHQMVRLFAIEQLYRAMTILRNEPYHHR